LSVHVLKYNHVTLCMILALTSFGFGACAFVAAVCGDLTACGMLIALAQCSVLHHSHGADAREYTGGSVVAKADKFLAHAVTLKCTYDACQMGVIRSMPVWASIAYVTVVYYAKIQHCTTYVRGRVYPWHVSIHVVSQMGLVYGYVATRCTSV